jgi:hypothetical protein
MKYIFFISSVLLVVTVTFAKNKEKEHSWYKPKLETTWHWQLSGKINTQHDVDLYIVDLFDTKQSTIEKLHKSGKRVIGYFSAGSFEEWRGDAKEFSKHDLGKKMDKWSEYWLDIRSQKVRSIMLKRLRLAKKKGFDGVEVDNIDGYQNRTGFALTSQDQFDYNVFLAKQAHNIGLAIALKNDVDQIKILEPYFDFHINEECHAYDECYKVVPFLKADKPVFNAEYREKDHQKFCKNNYKGLMMLTLPLELDDSFRLECR